MKPQERILIKLESVLDQLLLNAERLQEISRSQFLQEELQALQEKQEDLIAKMQEINFEFEKACRNKKYHSVISDRIEEKLKRFEQLNDVFIENLRLGRGLIQFEKKHKKE